VYEKELQVPKHEQVGPAGLLGKPFMAPDRTLGPRALPASRVQSLAFFRKTHTLFMKRPKGIIRTTACNEALMLGAQKMGP